MDGRVVEEGKVEDIEDGEEEKERDTRVGEAEAAKNGIPHHQQQHKHEDRVLQSVSDSNLLSRNASSVHAVGKPQQVCATESFYGISSRTPL